MRSLKELELIKLFRDWSGEEMLELSPIKNSGSNRQYFRLRGSSKIAVGVIGEDAKENKAFLSFSAHFKKCGLNVPEVYASDEIHGIYIVRDLGDVSLFDLLMDEKSSKFPSAEIENLYKRSLRELIRFQLHAGKNLDYSLCFPAPNLMSNPCNGI
ncbi:MAG: hypothetical protein R2764_14040 [Bacteroidales bacterium]